MTKDRSPTIQTTKMAHSILKLLELMIQWLVVGSVRRVLWSKDARPDEGNGPVDPGRVQ